MKKTLVLIVSAFLAASMLVACGSGTSGAEVDVTVEKYDIHNIFDSVSSNGTIEQGTAAYTVSTDIESYCVKNVYVKTGDNIKAGDKICEFDTENIKQQIFNIQKKISDGETLDEQTVNSKKSELEYMKQAQKINLDNLEKNVTTAQQKYDDANNKCNTALKNRDDAKIQYDDAKKNLDNTTSEEDISIYSSKCELCQTQLNTYTQEYETYYSLVKEYEDALNTSTSEYDSAKLQTTHEIESLQYEIDTYTSDNSEQKEELEKLNKALKNSIIYAPSDGIVTSVAVEEAKVSTESNLETIVNDSSKVIHLKVTDSDLLKISEGLKVEFYLISDSSNKLNGTISKINYVKGEDGFDVYV